MKILVDTRREGAGVVVELTDDGQLRIIVVVNWPSLGLLAQYDTLNPQLTRELRNNLAQALPPMLADLLPPGERGPDRLFTADAVARADELHATSSSEMHAARDRAMHAAPTSPPAWENPFAPDDQAAT